MTQAQLNHLETMRLRLCDDVASRYPNFADAKTWADSLLPDGSWPDIDYKNDSLKDWDARRHLSRLLVMALSLNTPASPHHQSERMVSLVLRGLDYWYAQNPRNPNWWWNEIGGPSLLGDLLVFLKPRCDRSYIDRAIPIFENHRHGGKRFAGQNLVWVSFVAIRHGILTGEPTRVAHAVATIMDETRIYPDGEGLQPDMSFHQHGKLLYNGGYGKAFALDVAGVFALTVGTPWAPHPSVLARFTSYMLDGSRWMIRGRAFDHAVTGREISRVGHDAEQYRQGLALLARVPGPRQNEVRETHAVDPLLGRSLVRGNRHFWSSDFMTHHRDAFYASVRMTSERILQTDGPHCGGEGRVCHHMADGVLQLFRDGDEYRDIYPVWNWRQIPGTTLAQPALGSAEGFDVKQLARPGRGAFVGGASDGTHGCAAMQFTRESLVASKAWFCFDDGVVALGSGITDSVSELPIRTTINQCRVRGDVRLHGAAMSLPEGLHAIAPGDAVWHDGFSYHIIDGHGTLALAMQSGAWSDCGVGSSERVTLPVFNMSIEHGAHPQGATYAYRVCALDAAAAFERPAAIEIIANSPSMQAVWHAGEKRGQAVLYEPGTVRFPDGRAIRADRACILLYRPIERGGVAITVADPAQRSGVLTLHITGRPDATISVTMPTREYAGASQCVTLTPD